MKALTCVQCKRLSASGENVATWFRIALPSGGAYYRCPGCQRQWVAAMRQRGHRPEGRR